MMALSLFKDLPAVLLEVTMCLLIIAFYLFGHWLCLRLIKQNPDYVNKELGAISGTLLGLLGLLLAFTFGMANSRYDDRRKLIVAEANDISTVILRTDIYPDSIAHLLKEKLKAYVEARINFYAAGIDKEKTKRYLLEADSISKEIWHTASNYAKKDPITTKSSELIPALNAMIDITTTRREAGEANIPDSIMYFLLVLCCCSAFLLGYGNHTKVDWVMLAGFTIMLSITVLTIVDLDRPRSGMINMDSTNKYMIELRQMFNQSK